MGKGKSGSMSSKAASRIQSVGSRNPGSKTSKSNFASRAQSAAAKNANAQKNTSKGKS
jgi:hypothetical protein